MPKNSWISTKTPAIVPESARSARWEGMKAERRQVWQAYACDYCLPNSWTENWQVRTREDCAQSGVKRCPDVDSVAKDRSGAGDNECAEMSRTVKCVDCLWAHGRRSGKYVRGGPQTKYFSRRLNLGGRRACFSDELLLRSACPLGCWLQNPPERTEGTNRKIEKMLRMRRKAGQ